MIFRECGKCHQSISQNESIKIDSTVYCANCVAQIFPTEDDLKGKSIEKEFDPTVCTQCSADFGTRELKKISRYPVCENCERVMASRTFPTWVKGFLVATLAIVIFAFIWNWKYYQAFNYIKKANASFAAGDYSNAYLWMNSASEKVTEVDDIYAIARYFKGLDLLTKDKSAEALIEFNNIKDRISKNFNIDMLILQARIGDAFDKKDYQGFLSAAKENLAIDSTIARSWASLASAYACVYADQGDENSHRESLKCLEKSKAMDSTTESKSYFNMIEYRLFSRRIIRREEFIKEFPNGWTKN